MHGVRRQMIGTTMVEQSGRKRPSDNTTSLLLVVLAILFVFFLRIKERILFINFMRFSVNDVNEEEDKL